MTNIKNVRTIALVGQAGSGKTTLAEALLAKAGAITSAGSVERGSTVCDYSPLEKQMQHSLKLSVASFEVKNGGDPTRVVAAYHGGMGALSQPNTTAEMARYVSAVFAYRRAFLNGTFP